MIIVLKEKTSESQAKEILDRIEKLGLKPLYMPGSERVVIGALGDERVLGNLHLESHPLVESVKPILAPYKLVSREMHAHDTVVESDPRTDADGWPQPRTAGAALLGKPGKVCVEVASKVSDVGPTRRVRNGRDTEPLPQPRQRDVPDQAALVRQ